LRLDIPFDFFFAWRFLFSTGCCLGFFFPAAPSSSLAAAWASFFSSSLAAAWASSSYEEMASWGGSAFVMTFWGYPVSRGSASFSCSLGLLRRVPSFQQWSPGQTLSLLAGLLRHLGLPQKVFSSGL
jgi:hypothetical protein